MIVTLIKRKPRSVADLARLLDISIKLVGTDARALSDAGLIHSMRNVRYDATGKRVALFIVYHHGPRPDPETVAAAERIAAMRSFKVPVGWEPHQRFFGRVA